MTYTVILYKLNMFTKTPNWKSRKYVSMKNPLDIKHLRLLPSLYKLSWNSIRNK